MAITKVITIKADTQGAVKSFDTLGDSIQEQKEITIEFEEELADLERQLKDTGKAAYSLGRADTKKRVSELKDAIKDQRLGLKKLNLERSKVGALKTNIKQQAKLNETYFESKEGLTDINRLTAEFALKLQAAKNIYFGAVDAVKKFAAAQRAAFIATGIGALLVAVGLLITYWDDIVDYVTDVNGKMQKQVDIASNIGGELDHNKTILEKQRKILELQGKSTDDILKAEKELLFERQKQNAQLLIALQTQLAYEDSKIREITLWEKTKIAAASALGQYKLAAQLTAESVLGSEEERQKRKDIVAQIQAATTAAFDLKLSYVELNKALDPEEGEGEEEKIRGKVQSVNEIYDLLNLDGQLQAEKLLQDASLQQTDEFLIQQADLREAAAKAGHDTELKWANLTAETKLGIAQTVLASVAGLVDNQSAAGKGIAIAQTGINTAQGIMQAFATLPTIPAFIAAALVGTTGLL